MSRVTITDREGVMVDSHTFKNGATKKTFILGRVKEEVDYYRIVSLDEDGDIINEGRIEMNYTEKTEKLGIIYNI